MQLDALSVKDFDIFPKTVYRGKQKCPFCGENHSFDECQNRDNKKCSSCGGSHSAGFKTVQYLWESTRNQGI